MLKQSSLFKRLRLIAIPFFLFCAVLSWANVWHSNGVAIDQRSNGKERLHGRVQDGLGREVQFAIPTDSSENIRSSVNSVARFISRRSGIKLSGGTKNRLATMEEQTLRGLRRRLSVDELSDILSITAAERLSTLKDQDIAHINDTLRGFNSPDLPEGYRHGRERYIHLRADMLQSIRPERFITQMKSLRDLSKDPEAGAVVRGMARNVIREEVKKKAGLFSEAVPEKFGQAGDALNDQEGGTGLTPLQAFLIAYSVASDDLLSDSESNLLFAMKSSQQASIQKNEHYPSPDGRFAFGVNGYLYSTPLDLIFDEQTLNHLLDHLEEKGL